MTGYAIGESGPELVNVTVNFTSTPDDILRVMRASMRRNHAEFKPRHLQAKTARKARERRQWHKVAGS